MAASDVRAGLAESLDFDFVSGPASHAECVREIMAFVHGDRIGLDKLKRVLPNIFKTFPDCDPDSVLLECGLFPCPGKNFPTFYFCPEKEDREMVEPSPDRVIVMRDVEDPVVCSQAKLNFSSSEILLCAYADVSSSWGSPRSSSNS